MESNSSPLTVSFSRSCEVWEATAKKMDDRLCFSFVQAHPSGYLMATDGTIAAIVPCLITNAPDGWEGSLIPAAFLKEAAKHTKSAMVEFTIEDRQVIAARKTGGSLIEMLGDTHFPRLDLILKSALRDKAAHGVTAVALDPWLLSRLALALGCDKNTPVCHEWSGDRAPILVWSGNEPDAVGVIMPGATEMARNAAATGGETLSSILGKLEAKSDKGLVTV
jgi:hypothetical protein